MLKKSNPQFSLHTLLSVAVLIGIAMGINTWIVQSQSLETQLWFPVFYPPLSILKFSVVCCPVIGLVLLLAAFWFWWSSRPLPLTPILFVSCIPVIFVGPASASVRILVALLLSTGLLYIEAIARKLPKGSLVAASCCLGMTGCYYMVVTSLIAGASV